MREIKFRVWNKIKNQMEESAYSKLLIQPSGSVCIQQDDNTLADVSHDYELMQFTGLYDKNGKEIYEGDIVRDISSDGRLTGNVVYDTTEFLAWAEDWNLLVLGGQYCEVIGNIYQNPELLK